MSYSVTGDLVSLPRGEARLRSLLAQLRRPFVVLGNHDVAVTRDPFSRAAELRDLEQAVLLRDDFQHYRSSRRAHRSRRRRPGVLPPVKTAPHELVDPHTTFRLLLCHFPGIVERIPNTVVRPYSRGTSPRRADQRSAGPLQSRRLRPSAGTIRRRPLRDSRGLDARLGGYRDDAGAVPFPRTSGGDGTRPSAHGPVDSHRYPGGA